MGDELSPWIGTTQIGRREDKMPSMHQHRGRSRGKLVRASRAAALALVVVAFGATASAAAATVRIVSQKVPLPAGDYEKIQTAVNASTRGDWVLIEPGTYKEAVKVGSAQSGIWIRGMNRNEVVIDGEHKAENGIEIKLANEVWVENLTVKNFDSGPGCPPANGECGNEIWWTGGKDSQRVDYHGWYGSYLTAYDTGLNGGYGLFAQNETEGSWNNIYASGFNDSGMYIGACQECDARVTEATMENNALGYSGSNSGGKLAIENSTFRNNSAGVVPNSENPGDGPPPQDGECGRENNIPVSPTPTNITSTNIQRCTVIRNNLITENNNLTVPVNGSTARVGFGVGVVLPGTYADLIEHNVISKNTNDGLIGIEVPIPFEPPFAESIWFQLAGNKISNNQFLRNGHSHGGPFTGDLTLGSGANEIFRGVPSESTNNCVSGNSFGDGTFPKGLQKAWSCQYNTTPNPGGAPGIYEYISAVPEEGARLRKETGQQPPPPQPTMPNPCEGVPENRICNK
jgi:hypothetical protein